MPPSDMPRTRRPEHRRTMPSETLEADTDEQDRAATGAERTGEDASETAARLAARSRLTAAADDGHQRGTPGPGEGTALTCRAGASPAYRQDAEAAQGQRDAGGPRCGGTSLSLPCGPQQRADHAGAVAGGASRERGCDVPHPGVSGLWARRAGRCCERGDTPTACTTSCRS